jgi:hypothetical protein
MGQEGPAVGCNAVHDGLLPAVTSPRVYQLSAGVIRRITRGRGHRDQVIRKARTIDGGEEMVVERERLGVLPIVGDVGLVVLRDGDVPTVLDCAAPACPTSRSV